MLHGMRGDDDIMKSKRRYFEVKPIWKKYPSARYYYLLGGRGTGKTYPVIKKCIEDYLDGKAFLLMFGGEKKALQLSICQTRLARITTGYQS